MQTASRVFLCLLLAFLTACNDGDSGPAQVTGTWTGTLTNASTGTQFPVVAAMIEGGPAIVYDAQQGVMYAISPLKDDRHIDGIMHEFPQDPLNAYGLSPAYQIIGAAYPDLMLMSGVPIGLTYCGLCAPYQAPTQAFAIRLTPYAPLEPFYAKSPLINPNMAGHWDGFLLNANSAIALDVTATGAWSGTDLRGCAWSGTFDQVGGGTVPVSGQPNLKNLFMVTAQGGFDALDNKCDGNYTGVGYLSSTGSGPYQGLPGLYFYMGIIGFPFLSPTSDVDWSLSGLMYEFKVQ